MTNHSVTNRWRIFFTLCMILTGVADVFAQSTQDMVFQDDFMTVVPDGKQRILNRVLTQQNGRAAWGVNKRKSDYQPKVRAHII